MGSDEVTPQPTGSASEATETAPADESAPDTAQTQPSTPKPPAAPAVAVNGGITRGRLILVDAIVAVATLLLVVGIFSDGPERYVIFVNRDYEKPRTAVIRFAPDVRQAVELAKGDRPPVRLAWPADQADRACVLEFEPGAARVLKLTQGKR